MDKTQSVPTRDQILAELRRLLSEVLQTDVSTVSEGSAAARSHHLIVGDGGRDAASL